MEADPTKTSRSRLSADIIGILVRIYGNYDLFVNEYRALLSDRLLSKLDFNTDQEVNYLELLKIRFGEAKLQLCEVMLKDVTNSKRIHSNIQSTLAKRDALEGKDKEHNKDRDGTSSVDDASRGSAENDRRSRSSSSSNNSNSNTNGDRNSHSNSNSGSIGADGAIDDDDDEKRKEKEGGKVAGSHGEETDARKDRLFAVPPSIFEPTIICTEFWPEQEDAPLTLPPPIQQLAVAYQEEYHKLKTPRVLEWIHSLGLVQLELELDDRTLDLTVSTTHAAIIHHFQEQTSWDAEELAAKLGIESASLRKQMVMWLQRRVIRQVSEKGATVYHLIESLGSLEADDVQIFSGFAGAGEAADSGDVEERSKIKEYEGYVLGIINNFRKVPMARIQSMLKLISGDDVPDATFHKLLKGLLHSGRILFVDGLYRKGTAENTPQP